MEKDRALQNAKIEYVKTVSNRAAHPFFWAAFHLIGDRSSIEFPEYTTLNAAYDLFSKPYTWLLLLALGIILFFIKSRIKSFVNKAQNV